MVGPNTVAAPDTAPDVPACLRSFAAIKRKRACSGRQS